MDAPQRSDQFPCPFCRSGSLLLIGANRRFQHYRCGDCAEVWTVRQALPLDPVGRSIDRPACFH